MSSPSKRARKAAGSPEPAENEEEHRASTIIAQFETMEGEATGPQLEVPLDATPEQMEQIVNTLLQSGERQPFAFYVDEKEVADTLGASVEKNTISTERILTVKYQPLSTFRVLPVTRCADSMPGHTEAVLHVSFSPDGARLASGGGDTTVRFWDPLTATPKHTCRGHRHHVLCTAWSPTGERFVSADFTGEIRVWDPRTGQAVGAPLKRHKKWVTSIAWEPLHLNAAAERFASASKDGTVAVWNVRTQRLEFSLSNHTDGVESVIWSGEGYLYTCSRDRTIKMWSAKTEDRGKLVRTLVGHAHRVNTMAVNSAHVCRSGPYDHTGGLFSSAAEAHERAKERYAEFKSQNPRELLVSGSDDFTLFLWDPLESKRPLQRLTGHVQAVNHIAFSPDGRLVASAGFDKKVKLWDGRNGRFITTFHGHVGAVYMVAWSPDSRFLVSASKDSTVKLWDPRTGAKAKHTLPGHADEVYALDWAPNGMKVASGSKDRLVKMWVH